MILTTPMLYHVVVVVVIVVVDNLLFSGNKELGLTSIRNNIV